MTTPSTTGLLLWLVLMIVSIPVYQAFLYYKRGIYANRVFVCALIFAAALMLAISFLESLKCPT